MLDETIAICLRIDAFSKTSHIVTWLTEGHGVLRTVIKGANRPKSWFLGQYDLFQTCVISFYARSRHGLHIIKDCTTDTRRDTLRDDWRASAVASYCCDLVTRSTFANVDLAGCFHLLTDTLDTLATRGSHAALMPWHELHFLRHMGLAPALVNCASCGKELPRQSTYAFSAEIGGLLCARCPSAKSRDARQTSPDTVAMLRNLQRVPTPAAALTLRVTPKQLLAFHRLLGTFMVFHLDMSPVGRRAAIEISTHS